MKKNIILLTALTILLNSEILIYAQSMWINGFSKRIAGENLDYHSCHPDANLALLIRCLNEKDYIEWITDTIPSNDKDKFVTFAWIAGYSVGTSTASHQFFLLVNDKSMFAFRTSPGQAKKDWQLSSANGAKLHFKFIKLDAVDDFFGYMVLTVPKKMLAGSNFARIKVKGDASGSKDWYMTMQYPLIPKTRISPEKVVSKNPSGILLQRVKISIDHFNIPAPVIISAGGSNKLSSVLRLGMNEFYLKFKVPKKPEEVQIKITVNGKTRNYKTVIKPARKITFYLIPHAHVDIGYTDLQPVVEKKHWKNYDKAIELSEKSLKYGRDAAFKWNTEVLWAVQDYLKKFPGKKQKFFNAVRKGWIGLDAAYGNDLTGLCRPEELYRWVEYSNLLEKEIGVKIQSAMITDVPGYTWGVVQAFADNGIKYFSVGPNTFDRIGYTLKTWGDKPFYWKSPSGKNKILVWVAGKGYSWFHHWRLTRDDFSPVAKYLDELDAEHYPYDMVQLRYNIGGDNGFPDTLLSKFVKQWNETHVTPKFKIATTMQMFKDFVSKYSKVIPAYSGDFTPYWEDGAGSTAKETAMNRNTAELLTQLETMYTLFRTKNFPQKKFDEAWRYVVLFSEHTWGAWNSISDPELKSVKEQWEIKKSYAIKADSIAHVLLGNLTINKTSDKPLGYFYVFNPSSWSRTDLITIPDSVKKTGTSLEDENGNKIQTQILSNGDLVFAAKNIPALGFRKYRLVKGYNAPTKISPLVNNCISNTFYDITFNEKTYSIDRLSRTGSKFNYADTSKGESLNQYIHTGTNGADPVFNEDPKLIAFENGPVLKSVTLKSRAKGCNNLEQKIILFHDLDRIEIVNTIDKKKNYKKENLRFAFPYNIKDPLSRINIAWAVIQPEKDQLSGANKNYFTAQRWVDVSNNTRGITLANVDAPLIELGGMNAEAWTASPDEEWFKNASSSSLLYSWVMNNSWHTNFKASQKSVATFRYFLKPHKHFNYLDTYKFGIESSQPLRVIYSSSTIDSYNKLVELDPNSSIVISMLYPSRDGKGIMIRVFNPTKKSGSSHLNWTKSASPEFFLSSGDEDEIHKISNLIKLGPFQVETIKINEN